MRLLIVEDDDKTAGYLLRAFAESGHVVDRIADGATGLAVALEGIYDALIVDRRLPGLDGVCLVRQLREQGVSTPILMLSAVATPAERAAGIRAGCDDYLAKPYAFVELVARLEALLRRADRARGAPVLRVADLELDTVARTATRAGRALKLQRREFLILEQLVRRVGQVVTRSMLLEAVWPYDFEPRGNIVDMHVHRLRRKVDEGFAAPLVHTVPGAGYMLREPPAP